MRMHVIVRVAVLVVVVMATAVERRLVEGVQASSGMSVRVRVHVSVRMRWMRCMLRWSMHRGCCWSAVVDDAHVGERRAGHPARHAAGHMHAAAHGHTPRRDCAWLRR